jgi:hypothetical protein
MNDLFSLSIGSLNAIAVAAVGVDLSAPWEARPVAGPEARSATD